MPRGGSRNRSGPPPDPNSLRSSTRNLSLRSLPAEGFDGKAPTWPLPGKTTREAAVWRAVWKSPQAVAWIEEPWRWRIVALWVRWSVRMEDPEASAALGNVVVRFADQIGMTPAGLRENGWQIGGAAKPAESTDDNDGDDLADVVAMFRAAEGS
jgi:hypothetical protein